jgi:pilus assembly protein CpaD
MPHTHLKTTKRAAGSRRLALLAPMIALSLGACGVDRAATSSIIPASDYRDNHPIVMAETPTSLDIFPGPRHMDRATEMRLREFAADYRANGVGQIEVLFPQGASNESSLRGALPEIRKSLAAGGASGYLSVGSYAPRQTSAAAPIRIAFRSLKARVAGGCGEWPSDLASASSVEGWQNRPYWNYGCAYQSMLATQTADARDLVAPRAETSIDVEMRRRAIEKVRTGTDPGTAWKVTNTSLGGIGN